MTAWDDGIRWHLEQTAEQAPDLDTYDPLTLDFVRDQHLRSPNGSLEDAYIRQLIRVSYRQAQRVTRRSLIPEGRTMVLDAFAACRIVFPFPNLISVDDIAYIDGDGNEQLLNASPEEFVTVAPSGDTAARGYIEPLAGQSWPSAKSQRDAVTITFQSGYPIVDGLAAIPDDINQGRLLMIGELYKQRSESVHAFNQNPALVRARDLWIPYRSY